MEYSKEPYPDELYQKPLPLSSKNRMRKRPAGQGRIPVL